MDKKKLLFVGISPQSFFSGQGRVARALVDRLKDFYDVRVAGWGCISTDYNGVFVYPNSESWWEIIPQWQPDVLFLSHDVWRFPQLPKVRKQFRNLKIIGYFTIDGDPISNSWFPLFDACDVILVPSKWGRDVIFERYSRRPIIVIPQGVELNLFYKVVDKESVKKVVDEVTRKSDIKHKLYHSGKFTIFFAGMNQSKKNIGVMLDGFRLFAQDKNDVLLILLMHTHKENVFGAEVLSDYNFADLYPWRDILDKVEILEGTVGDDKLVQLYLVSDVLLSPSIGEGFGLFVLEAMATGVIPIITNYSAFRELPHPDACFFLNVDAFYRARWNMNRAVVSDRSVCESLESAYRIWKNHLDIWRNMQRLNYDRVLGFSWDICANKIRKIIDDLLKNDLFVDTELRRLYHG